MRLWPKAKPLPKQSMPDANAETSALARDMCEKLLARNLTQQDDARLLDDLLQKAGDSNDK